MLNPTIPSPTNEEKPEVVAFLFGAGASVEAGVPDTVRLIEQFRNKDADPKVSAFLDRLSQWAQQQKRTVDIELVLETLQRLADWNEDPLSGFAENPVMVEGIDPHALLARLRDFIKEKVLVDASRIDYLKPLRGFVDAYRPLHIYSANYDTAIEVFCAENKLKYRDGFDEAWNPGVFDEPNADLRLFKLHGSVTWYRSNRGRFLKIPVLLKESSVELVTKERAEALMLYPAQKFEYVEPLFELLLETKRRLADCQVLIVVGYSFRDEHIRRLLWDIAREYPEFHVILISPDAREIYCKRLHLYEDNKTESSLARRVICLPFLFGKVLPELQPYLLREMLMFRENFEKESAQERRGHQANWELVALQAARCGDYETVRSILEKPSVPGQLDYSYRLEMIVFSLLQAVANDDFIAGKHFWNELRNAWRAVIDSLFINVLFFQPQGQNQLNVTVRNDNSALALRYFLNRFTTLSKEVDRRLRWMREDTESKLPRLHAVSKVLVDLQSAMEIWIGGGGVPFDKYESTRKEEMLLGGRELFKTLRSQSGIAQSSEHLLADFKQGIITTEQVVLNKVLEKFDLLWENAPTGKKKTVENE